MGTHFAAHATASHRFPKFAVSQGAANVEGALVQRVASGTILFAEGDDAECVFEVVSGTMRLYKALADGRRQITGFASGGQMLGLAPERHYVCTAEAVTPMVLRRYQRRAFDRRIDSEPGMARRILQAVSNELRMAQDQMLLLGRKSAAEKVASFLLRLAETDAVDGDVADHLDLPMGRGDVADYLGLTVETVSRTFTKLRNDGLIALPTPSSVEILDAGQLRELAAGVADDGGQLRRAAGW